MPKKTTKQKGTKKKSPVKSKVHNNILLLKKLEEKLSFLKDRSKQLKRGEPKLSFSLNSNDEIEAYVLYGSEKKAFFLNSNNEIEACRIYKMEKIFYLGKLEGKTFVFDQSVPLKLLPDLKERIDLSDTI